VKSIFCYPYVGKLVAMLHPETIIQGKEFTGIGVHVEMTEDLAPSEIVQKIRDAEKLLNIEKGAQIVVEMDNTLIELVN
jgi:predicted component of type VI protein secretion system